jgi:hypothetical protein
MTQDSRLDFGALGAKTVIGFPSGGLYLANNNASHATAILRMMQYNATECIAVKRKREAIARFPRRTSGDGWGL